MGNLRSAFGTVAAIIFRNIATTCFVNRKVFGKSPIKSFVLTAANVLVFALIYFFFGTTRFCDMKFLQLCYNGILNMLWINPALWSGQFCRKA